MCALVTGVQTCALPRLQFERRCAHARHVIRIAYMRPNDPAGVDEAGGYARAIRAEPIGYRIDIDAVEIMEQEQRARQRGQPPDRGDPDRKSTRLNSSH